MEPVKPARTIAKRWDPQRKEPGFSHPLLTCDMTGVDEDLIGWRDNFRGYEYHSLFNDANHILGGRPVNHAFSIFKQWNL